MRRKSLKSSRQIFMLKRYLQQRPDHWPKDEVIKLAKEINLSRAQVYKWLWDQRNLVRSFEKESNTQPKVNSHSDQFKFKEEKGLENEYDPTLRRVTLRSQSQYVVLSIPENIEFAVKFMIPRSTPLSTSMILKKYGYELTRDRNNDFSDSSEKHERQPRISEFREVKEEYGYFEK